MRGIFAQLRTAWSREDDRPGPTERIAPGYTLVDVGAGMTVLEGFDLRLSARNLLNDDYLASQDVRAVPAPGRSVARHRRACDSFAGDVARPESHHPCLSRGT